MKLRFHLVKSVSAAAIIAFSLSVAYSASRMDIYSDYGPGAGLFPLVLSLLLAILTLIWLLTPVRESEVPGGLARDGVVRVLSILFAVALSIWWMPYLGFALTSFIAIFAIMIVTGKHGIAFTAGLAGASSLGFLLLFRQALGLSLPASQLPMISSLGL
jgi:hypothetical protein